MGRFLIGGFLAPGASTRFGLSVRNSAFNPSGDWGNIFAMAHPRNAGAELLSTSHSKLQSSTTGRFFYTITITNIGPAVTFWDFDL
jgi:hypothetical protein